MRSAARQSHPRPRKRRGAELRPGPAASTVPCRADGIPSLISIIGNLLDNAIEATQRAELPHEPVEVLIQLNARELIIEVADRGVGIRPDIRERIFGTRRHHQKPVAITALVCILLNIMSLRRAAPSKSPITRRGDDLHLFIRHALPSHRRPTMHHDLVDVLIIEDESELARLHAELVQKHPRLRLAGMAASLAQARQLLHATPPQLVLLDNYLPDGKGVTLMTDPALATSQCSVIFITAASDMETCSQAIRNGAFDYILKPVSWKRLSQSLERFIQFYDQQREWKIVDQQNVDSLYQLQAKNYRVDSGSKGIEEKTLALVQGLFSGREAHCFSVDEVVSAAGLSKTTARRYLEHGVETGFLEVEMLYGKIGHPRRLYRRAQAKR